MFFSIIIPTYNSEFNLTKTLESVLIQTCKDYEIIIIDDCSKDNTKEILLNFKEKFNKIKVIYNDFNIGVAATRDRGIMIAEGKYIAFLDSDDIWDERKLEKQKHIIEKTECDLCYTSYSFIDKNSEIIKLPYLVKTNINYTDMLKENFIGCSSVVLKTTLAKKYKMDNGYYHEDYALWLNLLRNKAKLVGTSEILMQYRLTKDSRSYNKINSVKHRWDIYRNQEKISWIKSIYYLGVYILNGLNKYNN